MFILLITLPLIASGSEEKDKVNITCSWWGAKERNESMEQIIESFQETNKEISVSGRNMVFDEYHENLFLEAGMGNLPDVVFFDWKWMNDISSDLIDLSPFLSLLQSDKLNMEYAYRYCTDNNGVLKGIPAGLNARGMLVNENLLHSFGIDFENNLTWPEIVEAGKSLHEKDNDCYLLFIMQTQWTYFVRSFIRQYSGNDIITDDGKIGCTSDDLVAVFSFIRTLIDNSVIPPFDIAVLYEYGMPYDNSLWRAGRIGMIAVSSSTIYDTEGKTDFPLAVMRYPVLENYVDGGIYVAPSMIIGISRNSKHRKEAAAFIGYMLSDSEAIRATGFSMGLPMTSTVIAPKTNADNLAYQMVEQALSIQSRPAIRAVMSPDVEVLINKAVYDVGFNRKTPKEAAAWFMSELDEIT